jgi:murein DD-endopeptidase MepM/ murein hydrolase activator NlpD
VVLLPPQTVVLDLTGEWQPPPSPWSVGRYGEDRGIYTQPLFAGAGERRSVHLGVDLGGPAGVAVHAPAPGTVVHAGYNPADGDYGNVLVTRHEAALPGIDGPWFLLFGHLSAASLERSPVGRPVMAGTVVGWLGTPAENGGWPPHVHVQLGRMDPDTHDMPGACRPSVRAQMMHRFPDPAVILGRVLD